MKVLVTGGAGFIGSHVVDSLVEKGHQVGVLDDLSTGYEDQVHPKAELHVGSVADEDAVGRAMAGVDGVVHVAAHRSVVRSIDDPLATDWVNVHGTLTVLRAAQQAGARRVVLASSSSVYGGTAPRPTTEEAPFDPRSPYAVSKVAGEHYARVFWELFGLETVSLRYFNVYGPRQRPDSVYAAVIPLFAKAFRDGAPVIVHGDGLQTRDFTYVSDAAAGTVAALCAPAERCAGKAYNIAGGASHSLMDVIAGIAGILGPPAEILHTDPRPGDVRHTEAAIDAARRDLDHTPRVALNEGLRQAVASD